MNAIDERAIREQLERAVEVIEPIAPPLDGLRTLARRRRRARRYGGGFLAVAAMAAIVLIAVVVVPGGSGKQTVRAATMPSRQSFLTFAAAHGALKELGPYEEGNGFYGAFTTRAGVGVAKYRSNEWTLMGSVVTSLGSGRYIRLMGFESPLQSAGSGSDTPSLSVHTLGGDVSYYGARLREMGGRWQPAMFGSCGHGDLCPPGTTEPYLHHSGYGLVSVQNDCVPYCAAGTDYRVRWNWSPILARFVAVKVTPLSR